MRGLLTRALAWSSVLVGVLVAGVAGCLLVAMAAEHAEAADRHDAITVAAVLAVTTDPDAVRGAVARTRAGAEGRLAVRLPSGEKIGMSNAADGFAVSTVDSSSALITLTPAPRATPGLWLSLCLLLLAVATATWASIALGRRLTSPMLQALRVLATTASDVAHQGLDKRIHATGPPELVALATAINAAADRTERLLAKEREMIADVSHRLRTPLTALRLDADAIGGGPVAERIRRAVSVMGRDVDRIIESLRPVPAVVAEGGCDVAEVVTGRMAFWAAHAADQGRACEVDVPYESTCVSLTADALGAVVDALLENVFHHTPARTPLSVAVVKHAGWITLVVEDGGPGIANPERALHRGASTGGSTGLGLDIARAAAEATNGTIHLERGRLGGARIRLRLGEANTPHEPTSPRAWRLWQGHS
ncbi:sensor histidine kinase [Saccharothrix obliqua]|uniref:sensor histidine kinase n=1 Tax=Saccharothrix obliqua TaxID=2861747 RepID=UPI001C5D4656|nr:HAMP domain-containing sensor histidine kinase [Saccharothrix obliqua]MBW4716863.1 HAMP domain-containing histidine kinase [Saccharothrix obliqua]